MNTIARTLFSCIFAIQLAGCATAGSASTNAAGGDAEPRAAASDASNASDAYEGSDTSDASEVSYASTPREVEAGCGTCIFGMKGIGGCPLAVRIDGKAYLVEGSSIDDHGDAHAADGLCNVARQADVIGHIAGDKFVAESFVLQN